MDALGDTYVGGSYVDSVRFGPQVLVTPRTGGGSSGSKAAFVTKVSATGQWIWTATATGAGQSYGNSDVGVLAASPTGGVVVTGYFSDSVRFGATSLGAPLASRFWSQYLAQLSATGQWQWAVAIPGVDVRAMATDATGNIVLAGVLSDTVIFGATRLISRGEADTFVAKITPAGQWLWAVQGGGLDEDGALGVAVRPGGTIYVTGGFSSNAVFGTISPPSTGLIDGYVAELSATGQWQWVEPIPSGYLCYGVSLLIEPGSGDLFVGGGLITSATFGPTVLLGDSVADGFVGRFDPTTRVWRWASAVTSPGTSDVVLSLATEASGAAVYAAGEFGALDQSSGPGPYPIATATFGALAVPGFGGSDGFLGRLDGVTGQWQNATAWGGTTDEFSGGIAALPAQGGLVVSGLFTSPTASVGPFTLTTNPATVQYPAELLIARLELRPLGLHPAADEASFSLAPNPAGTVTRLTLTPAPTARPLVLFDALGQAVRTNILPANQTEATLDLYGLPAGLYVVRAGALTRRLVVE